MPYGHASDFGGFPSFFHNFIGLFCPVGSSPVLIIDVSAAVQELDRDSWKENRVSHFDFCFRLLRLFRFLLLG